MTCAIYFNPRTPCGVRRGETCEVCGAPLPFQSTHPMRGATYIDRSPINPERVFQSTHPMRGATWIGASNLM